MKSTIFLFAHQDDEFGIFQKIDDAIATRQDVYCIFFTDGVAQGRSAKKRNLESTVVLMKLGVQRKNILFVGEELLVSDGSLVQHLVKVKKSLGDWLSTISNIDGIYLPAWEGGHPDHDCVHAIGVIAAKQLNLLDKVWQFPLYNGYRCSGQLFRVLLPLPSNGEVMKSKINWFSRFRYLSYILCYRSQVLTWLGLAPFVIIHFIAFGTQNLQRASVSKIINPPHLGRLYYERRKFCTWDLLSDKLKEIC